MTIHYLNLTNGLEALSHTSSSRFLRIQSTACEQKRWDFLLQDLDNDFLMNLAVGHHCIVWDFGHNGMPRALWQGISFIQYVLNRHWLKKETRHFRGKTELTPYFKRVYAKLEKRTFKKLDYFKKFLLTENIRLDMKWGTTKNDGKEAAWWREEVRQCLQTES